MFNKYNFSIKEFCSNNSVRPELGGVFIKPNESVATDSYCLIKVDSVKGNLADYPVLPNRPSPKDNFDAFILPKEKAEEVEKIAVKLNKAGGALPIIKNIVVLKRDKNIAEMGGTDLESVSSVESRIIDEKYPEYEDLLVERGAYVSIILNPAFLLKIAKFYNDFLGDKRITGVEMRVPIKEDLPVRFNAKNNDTGQEAKVVLMPIKSQ